MPAGSHKYFEQIDPWGGYISVDDPKFVEKVRAKLGPKYEHLVDEKTKKTAQNLYRPDEFFNVAGQNFSYSKDPVKSKKQALAASVSSEQYKNAILPPLVTILGYGAAASPQMFAHEFRHNKIYDEEPNRFQDIYAANSPAEYHRAVTDWVQLHHPEWASLPFSEKEKLFPKNENEHPYENLRREAQNILSSSPQLLQRNIERKAAEERVNNPYLNFVGKTDMGYGVNTEDFLKRILNSKRRETNSANGIATAVGKAFESAFRKKDYAVGGLASLKRCK